MAEMKPGIARPKALPTLWVEWPAVTSGGLDYHDISDFADLVEVLLRTGTDPNAQAKLMALRAWRRVLHFRFDKKCKHGRDCARTLAGSGIGEHP